MTPEERRPLTELEQRFLDLLPEDISPPEMQEDEDGEMSFEWYAGPRSVFCVSVGKNGTLSFAGLYRDGGLGGKANLTDGLPESFLNHIRRVRVKT